MTALLAGIWQELLVNPHRTVIAHHLDRGEFILKGPWWIIALVSSLLLLWSVESRRWARQLFSDVARSLGQHRLATIGMRPTSSI